MKKKNEKPFGKFQKLVVASAIASLGTILSTASACGSASAPKANCDQCVTDWNYTHGGYRTCGAHSCGGGMQD